MENNMTYQPDEKRYNTMKYNPAGNSGLKLPAISYGLWHSFGDVDDQTTARQLILTAFDHGITHFDLANNYGPPPGSAERNFAKILQSDLKAHRDELVISSKAGHPMWPGPYGDGAGKKYLIASLDQSLQRMGLDYVDIFYSHRPDSETPVEETCDALIQIVRQGKVLFIGISKYSPADTQKAFEYLKNSGIRLLIHQPPYSMFNREIETNGTLQTIEFLDIGCIAFCPLAQGLLTDKYIQGIPADSRAAKPHGFLQKDLVTDQIRQKIIALNELAKTRGQTLAQMALAWVLRDSRITSALIGASQPDQILQNLKTFDNLDFSADELKKIDEITNSE